MGFRFRKSFSLGKGIRLNLGKTGLSTSFRIPGVSLNVSKRGIRPTVGLPGTGISYSPSQGKENRSQQLNISDNNDTGSQPESIDDIFEPKPKGNSTLFKGFIFSIIACIGIVCVGAMFAVVSTDVKNTPTPDLILVVKSTANAAQTQTMSYAPIPATETITPFVILETVTMQPPVSLVPTWTLEPTWTPFTLNVPTSKPSSGGGGSASCSCSGDRYDCKDFSSWDAAQTCWTRCYLQGYGDPNHLDNNGDGLACENLLP